MSNPSRRMRRMTSATSWAISANVGATAVLPSGRGSKWVGKRFEVDFVLHAQPGIDRDAAKGDLLAALEVHRHDPLLVDHGFPAEDASQAGTRMAMKPGFLLKMKKVA